MGERYVPRDSYTGREFETDLFGRFNATPGYQKELQKLVSRYGSMERIPFAEGVRLVLETSADDPNDPKNDFLRDLRIEIADQLELPDEKVLAYTTQGTPVDFKGGDAIIIVSANGREEVVTLDSTLNPKKLSGEQQGGDVVIGDVVPDPKNPMTKEQFAAQGKDVEKEYLSAVEGVALRVIKIINERKKRKRGGAEPQISVWRAEEDRP